MTSEKRTRISTSRLGIVETVDGSSSSSAIARQPLFTRQPMNARDAQRPSMASIPAIPLSIEIEVYGLLGLRDLLPLSRVSRNWRAQIGWFLQSEYHGGRVDLDAHDLHSIHLFIAGHVNIRDCCMKTMDRKVMLQAQDTIRTLRLGHVGLLASFNDMGFRFPRLASLSVESVKFFSNKYATVAIETFLTTHSTLTTLDLPESDNYDPLSLGLDLPLLRQLRISFPRPLCGDALDFLKRCERFDHLTSLCINFQKSRETTNDEATTSWFAPLRLKKLTLTASWLVRRVISSTLQTLSLNHFDARVVLGTIRVDCPGLTHLSLLDSFSQNHTLPATLILDSGPPSSSSSSSSVTTTATSTTTSTAGNEVTLHTLVTTDDGPGEPYTLTLLQQGVYLVLRYLRIHCRIKPSVTTCSLTSYFLAITRACPRLETLRLAFVDDDERTKLPWETVVDEAGKDGHATTTTPTRTRPRFVMPILSSLKLHSFVVDAARFQHRFFLDVDELVRCGYEFPQLRFLRARLLSKSSVTARRFLQSLPCLHTLELYDFAINNNNTDEDVPCPPPSSSFTSERIVTTATTLNKLVIEESVFNTSSKELPYRRYGWWSIIMTWFANVRQLHLLLCCVSRDSVGGFRLDGRLVSNPSEVCEWFDRFGALLLQHGPKIQCVDLDLDRRHWLPVSWNKVVATECQRLLTVNPHLDRISHRKQCFIRQPDPAATSSSSSSSSL